MFSLKKLSLWVAAAGPGLIVGSLLISSSAHAIIIESYPERAAVLRNVFGARVERGLSSLEGERFKGASELALSLAFKVRARELTLEQARERLLDGLKRMEQSADVTADPGFEVVGALPVGASVAKQLVPGAESWAGAVAMSNKIPPIEAESAVAKDDGVGQPLADDDVKQPAALMVDEAAADDRSVSSVSE